MTLYDMAPGREGIIARLGEHGAMRRGFTQGALARCEFLGPSGGMRAYRVRGALVALRRENARNIFLEG